MTVAELLDFLNEQSPFSLAQPWDNSGLQLGSPSREISAVVLALDVAQRVLEAAPPGSLVLVHHPLFFSGVKSINIDEWTGKLVSTAIKKDISIAALHTNFDATHLGRFVMTKVLGFDEQPSDSYVRYAAVNYSFDELESLCRNRFDLKSLSCVPTEKRIRRVALCTGSGGSLVGKVDADVLITGDVKYHERFAAAQSGLGIIDVGHYETERYFTDALAEILKVLPLEVIILDSQNPTHTYPKEQIR